MHKWMLWYVLVKDIKDNLKLINNTYVFEPNISVHEKTLSENFWKGEFQRWISQSQIQLPSAEDREKFIQNIWFKNVSVGDQF